MLTFEGRGPGQLLVFEREVAVDQEKCVGERFEFPRDIKGYTILHKAPETVRIILLMEEMFHQPAASTLYYQTVGASPA